MTRTPVIATTDKIYSPNLESDNRVKIQPRKTRKIVSKTKIAKKQDRTLANFWRLIVITSVIFGFGGLGFGIALRCGKTGIIVNSLTANNQGNLLNQNQ